MPVSSERHQLVEPNPGLNLCADGRREKRYFESEGIFNHDASESVGKKHMWPVPVAESTRF